jgi:hypothetical protein
MLLTEANVSLFGRERGYAMRGLQVDGCDGAARSHIAGISQVSLSAVPQTIQ